MGSCYYLGELTGANIWTPNTCLVWQALDCWSLKNLHLFSSSWVYFLLAKKKQSHWSLSSNGDMMCYNSWKSNEKSVLIKLWAKKYGKIFQIKNSCLCFKKGKLFQYQKHLTMQNKRSSTSLIPEAQVWILIILIVYKCIRKLPNNTLF